jgi:hypothetical protein
LAVAAASTRAADPSAPSQAAAPPQGSSATTIDPRADDLLRAVCKYLTDAKSLAFSADVWEDVVSEGGRKLQSQRTTDVAIRRPDRIVAHSRTERKSRDAYYDGKSLTIYNPATNFYGIMTDVPKNIDETVDFVAQKFGVTMPLSDLITSDIPGSLLKDVRRGDYLGRQRVAGVDCHHRGFIQENIDWQLWIEEGNQPLIRRVVITYKNEPQSPQFSATISDWRIDPPLPDFAFQFRAPAGASKIDVLPAQAPSNEPGGDPSLAREVQPPAGNANQVPPNRNNPKSPAQEKSK